MLVTVLPDQKQRAWVDGPVSAPLNAKGLPVTPGRRASLLDVLGAEWSTDAHVQPLQWVDAPEYAPRASNDGIRDNPGKQWAVPVVFVDLDRPEHAAWPTKQDATMGQIMANAILCNADLQPTAIYATRAGLRLVFVLEEAVPATLWGWYGRWVQETLAPLDWAAVGCDPDLNCISPVHTFRLPRTTRDGVLLDPPPMILAPEARLRADVDPSKDTYSPQGARRRVSWTAPLDLPDRVTDEERWGRARLLEWATAPFVPSEEDRASPAFKDLGPSDTAGFRTTLRHLAGKAVSALSKHLARDKIPAEAFALLAPLAEACAHGGCNGCTHDHSTAHGDRSEYLAALLRLFVADLPEGPLILCHPNEQGYLLRKDDPGGSVYFRVPTCHLVTEIRRNHPHVKTTRPKQRGQGDKVLDHVEIYDRHGRTIQSRRWSYLRPTSFDQATGEFVVCVASPLEIEPERNPDVELWLETLTGGGDVLDALVESLATARHLEKPWASLWLPGPAGCGKQLISVALAAMFGGAPVRYQDAVGRFNAALLQSPVVAMHEGTRGAGDSYALRTLVSEGNHRMEDKHVSVGKLEGFVRLVADSNNPDPYNLAGEDLTTEDEEALANRINRIPVLRAARDLLEARGNWLWTNEWVEAAGKGKGGGPGVLCKHIAWVETQVAPNMARRFLGGNLRSGWAATLTAREGLARDLMLYLALAATTWDDVAPGGVVIALATGPGASSPTVGDLLSGAIMWQQGEALVRVAELRKVWGLFVQDERRRPPSLDKLTAEAAKLHEGADRARWPVRGGTKQTRVRRIPMARILDVADEAGIGDEEAIKSRMVA